MMRFKMPKGFTSRGAVQGNSYDNGGSSGNGGGNRGGGSGNGFGGGAGGNGGDGRRMTKTRSEIAATDKYSEDVLNVLDANAQYNLYTSEELNAAGKARYGEEYTQEYQDKDYAYRGIGNSQPSDDLPLIKFHTDPDGSSGGRWHGSIQEMEKSLELRFNAGSSNSINTAVKVYLSLTEDKSYYSEARIGHSVSQVQISHTVRGKQQAEIDHRDVQYSNSRPIGGLFDRIKFKPG